MVSLAFSPLNFHHLTTDIISLFPSKPFTLFLQIVSAVSKRYIFIVGQTATDLAKDSQMSQVLCVRPVRQLQKTVNRFEGQLLKRSRFLGWKPTWVSELYYVIEM